MSIELKFPFKNLFTCFYWFYQVNENESRSEELLQQQLVVLQNELDTTRKKYT